jgi:hypothetical protein
MPMPPPNYPKLRRNYTREQLAVLREAFLAGRDPKRKQGNLL